MIIRLIKRSALLIIAVLVIMMVVAGSAHAREGEVWLAHGPYVQLPDGTYEAVFFLKTSEPRETAWITSLDVIADAGAVVFGGLNLTGRDFGGSDQYKRFTIALAPNSKQSLEFRIKYYSIGNLMFDKVELWKTDAESKRLFKTIEGEDPGFGHFVGAVVKDETASNGKAWGAASVPKQIPANRRPLIVAAMALCCGAIGVGLLRATGGDVEAKDPRPAS